MNARSNARKVVPVVAARKPAARRTVAAEKATPAKAPVKSAPAKAATPDFAALANGATVAKSMPKRTRTGGTSNPFVPLLERSLKDGKPLALPAIANDDATLKTVVLAVRRAARIMGIGVSIGTDVDENGIVVTMLAKARKS